MRFTTALVQPVFYPGYPFSLGMIVDTAYVGALYFERRYLDINREQLEVITTLIPANLYGQYLRLSIQDEVLKAACFIEVSIDSTDKAIAGTGERIIKPVYTTDSLTRFTTTQSEHVKFNGYPLHLGIIVDLAMSGKELYYERRYLDINRRVVDIKSTLIPEESYGTYLRLSVPDDPLACAAFVEVSIEDEDNTMNGICPGTTDPDEPAVLMYDWDERDFDINDWY